MKVSHASMMVLAGLMLTAGVALAGVVTCPSTVFDRFGAREWHIVSAHPRVTGGLSIMGIEIIESKITLVAVYRADDGTMRTVDCGDIAT